MGSLGNPLSSGSGSLTNGLRYSFENYELPSVTPSSLNTNTANSTNTTDTNITDTNRRFPRNSRLFRLFDGPDFINNNSETNTATNGNNEYTRMALEDVFINYFTELLSNPSNRSTIPIGLTTEEINISTIMSNFNIDVHDIRSCSICVASYENNDDISIIVNCDHQFHTNCINTWLRNHNTCPLCRTNVLVHNLNNNDRNTRNTSNRTNSTNNTNQDERGIDSLD